ncbi:MAG: lipid-A-disaccharide synthase [Ignavibacteria bacterium]|nr:lipid-A-disaccharide synthase [Ignavibacteria bacterium]
MTVFITAGDPSADIHAARLMAEIRARVPEVVFEGFGGPNMELQGLRTVAHLADLAVSGFWEVAKRYRYFSQLLNKCKGLLGSRKPDVFIPVDYPGFNLRLATHAKKLHIPVAWYIAPQLWAWGENRAVKLANAVDKLLVVFPFEVEFFAKHNIKTEYVGHPVLDEIRDVNDVSKTGGTIISGMNISGMNTGGPIIMMPGSRKQELHHHVPILAQTIGLLHQSGIKNSVVIPMAAGVDERLVKPLTNLGATIVKDAREHMNTASAGLIKAGTSTLEASLAGLPFATYYRTSTLSYQLSKRLVTVDSITMMNLLLKRNVINEFVQHRATPQLLVNELKSLISNAERRSEISNAAAELRTLLGGAGAARRAAEVVCGMVKK